MKKKSLMLTLAFLMFLTINIKAQTKLVSAQGQIAVLEPKANNNESFVFPEIETYNGSYQFIVKQKKNFLFTTETFQIIENNRRETEDVIVTLNEFLDVFIYSKQSVNQSAFKPFKTSFILK